MTDESAQATAVDDPAVAFEELRRAVALTLVAIEGLAAARERIPDYSETFGEMLAAMREVSDRLARVEVSPAITLSPAAMAAEIVKAGEVARAADQKLLHEIRDEMLRAIGRLGSIVDHGRAAHHQRRFLIFTAIGAGLGATLLMAVLPGVVARSLPASWHVPEWMAARTIGLDQREAGETAAARERLNSGGS